MSPLRLARRAAEFAAGSLLAATGIAAYLWHRVPANFEEAAERVTASRRKEAS
jgi:hypothetical protein